MSKWKIVDKERTIRDVNPGELVICPKGNEHKVLDRKGDIVAVSECGLFSRFGFLYNIENMVLLKYKLKDPETEEDELEEVILDTIMDLNIEDSFRRDATRIAKAIREKYKISKKQ